MRKFNSTVARLIESPTAANTSGQVCLLSLQTYKELHIFIWPSSCSTALELPGSHCIITLVLM